MPQMSPMWWLYMLIMFMISMLVMNSMIYFNFSHKNKKPVLISNYSLIWKW